ncbi:MAG: FeoB-associated Cys-rich membrane protein [Clostridia bacterium]|nr:FeoB-associated Cys-rich membrane protein [Clostridia bacterium]
MLGWIASNLASIIILLVVVACIGTVVFKMVRDKKKGKSSCSCGCGGCPMSDSCHSKK